MKENMEAIYEKAVDVAQSAKRTAVLLATISQKKLLIAREQEKIRRNYTRIGKVYYKDYVTDEEPDEAEYKPLCEEISNSFPGVEKSFAIQSGREVRIMVKPEDVNDAGTLILAKEIVKRIENEMEYPGQIKVSVIRETRSVEFAK